MTSSSMSGKYPYPTASSAQPGFGVRELRSQAALRAVQDEARSSVPALGYTVPYAIGNILLTAWGPVIVALMSIGK